MTLSEAVRVLVLGAGRGFPIIDRQGLRTLFPGDEATPSIPGCAG